MTSSSQFPLTTGQIPIMPPSQKNLTAHAKMQTTSYQPVSVSLQRSQPYSLIASFLAAIFALIAWIAPHLSAAPPSPDKVTILPAIPDALDLVVIDLNNQGQIIGIYFDFDWNPCGFFYANGIYTLLEFFPSRINNQGQIVGWSYDGDFNVRSFLYYKGTYSIIDAPDATHGTFISDINNAGRIVGTYYDNDFNNHYIVYDRGVFTHIEIPGAAATWVSGINDRGQIVGTCYDSDFQPHGFVLSR